MAGSHILRRGCCLALLLAASLPVMAAQVAIPPLTNGAGDRVDATIGIRLVDANGQNVVAFNASNLATEYRNLPLGAAGLTLTLAPQVALALPAGGATYYQIDAKWPGGTARWRFQVADTETLQSLRDLIGAEAIQSGDLIVEWLADIQAAASATAADRVQTGLDATATGADRVQTGLDAAATAADRVQTGLDAAAAVMNPLLIPLGFYGWSYIEPGKYGGVDSCDVHYLPGFNWMSLKHELSHCQGYADHGIPLQVADYTDEQKEVMAKEGVTHWTDTHVYRH